MIEAPPDPTARRRWIGLAFICLAIWIQRVDATIVNVAVPRIGDALDASNADLQWVVDTFNVVVAGIVLVGAGLADRYGRRRIFAIGMAFFTLGSVITALSPNIQPVLSGRVVMGVGTGLAMPASLALIAVMFTGQSRKKAVGIWMAVGGLGIAMGPMIGGLLLNYFGWASVFWVNVPTAVLGGIGVLALTPESRKPHDDRLDVLGAALSVVALGSIVFGLIEGPGLGWSSPLIIGSLSLGIAALVAFIYWENKCSAPMFDINVLRNPLVSVCAMAMGLVWFTTFVLFYLMPLMFRYGHDYPEYWVGIAMVPLGLMFAVLSQFAPWAMNTIGLRRLLVGGLTTVTVALVVLALNPRGSYVLMAFALVGFATGWAAIATAATTAIMDALPMSKAGDASAVNQLSRQVGAALGIAITGSVVAMVYRAKLILPPGLSSAAQDHAERSISQAANLGRGLPEALDETLQALARDAFDPAFTAGLLVPAAIALGTAIAAFFIVKPGDKG